MATYRAGRGVATYELDTKPFEAAMARIRQQWAALEALHRKGLQVPGANSSAIASANSAAAAQQRLATQTARTTQSTASAALEAQRLATEEQRTARAANQAEIAALRLAQAREREARAGQGGQGGLGPALPRTVDGLSGSAASLAKALISVQVIERGFSLVRTGAQAVDARRALDNLAVSANTTGDALVDSLRRAAQGTIRDSTLIQAANTGILLTQGRITSELPRLVEIARASAKATGQDVGFIFDSLVRGIARGSPLIIDNAGITLNAAQAFEVYAQSIGKSADQLTKSEQQQATLNAVLESGSAIVQQVGLDANSAASNIDRAVTSVQNLGDALAQKIAPFIGSAAQGIADLLNAGTTNAGAVAAGNQVQAGLVQQATSYEDYAARVIDANNQIFSAFGDKPGDDPAGDALARQQFGLSAINPVLFAYTQGLIANGQGAEAAYQAAQRLAGVSAELDDVIRLAAGGNTQLRAELIALAPQLLEVAGTGDAAKAQVLDLIAALDTSSVTAVPGLAQALNELIAIQDAQREAAAQEAREMRNLERSFAETLPSVNALGNALLNIGSAADVARRMNRELQDRSGIGALGGGLGGEGARGSGQFPTLRPRGTPRGLALPTQPDLDTLTDYVARLDAVNARLARGNLSERERRDLLREKLSLEEKIAQQQERQQDAALGAAAAAIEDRKARRQEQRQLARLDALAAQGGTRGHAAADEAALIRIRQEQRARALNRQAAEAGGVVPTTGTVPATVPPPQAAQSAAQAGAAGGAVTPRGPLTLLLSIDRVAFARATAGSVDELLNREIRLVSVAGG